jgi:hypothetical protein
LDILDQGCRCKSLKIRQKKGTNVGKPMLA